MLYRFWGLLDSCLAADADRRKDEFLAMLAHELRNPLAPIRNAVEIQKRANMDPTRITWCTDIIDRQINHLTGLVDDLLDISRISRGLVELKKETLEIRDFIQPAVETNQPLIDTRKQEFSMTLPPEPVWVEGDRIRLAQVVSNLINNAAKYTEEGGRIGLSVELSGDDVCIGVTDSGCGIDSANLSNLFDLFYQADRHLDRSQGGLGIGLSLVRSLVDRGVAIFAKAFMGIPAQQAAKTTRPLMPAAAPAVLLLSLDTQQGVSNIILAMTRRDFGKPAFSLRKKRFVKTHALSLLGTTRLLSRSGSMAAMCERSARARAKAANL